MESILENWELHRFETLYNFIHPKFPSIYDSKPEQFYKENNGLHGVDFNHVSMDLIKKYPNVGWNYAELSRSPKITMKDILENPEIPWSWLYVSQNPNVTMKTVLEDELDLPWNYDGLSINPSITMTDVQENIGHPWNWLAMSKHPNLTMDFLLQYPNKSWRYADVSENPNLTFDAVLSLKNKTWCWESVSRHKNVTMEMIQNNPRFKWVWSSITKNPNLTEKFLLANVSEDWDWNYVVNNALLPLDKIQKHLPHRNSHWEIFGNQYGIHVQYPLWNCEEITIATTDAEKHKIYKNLSNKAYNEFYEKLRNIKEPIIGTKIEIDKYDNSKFNIEFAISYGNPNQCWQWENISKSKYLSIDEIFQHPELPWNWRAITKRKDLTLKIMLENPDKEWDWHYMTGNGNWTFDDIFNNPDAKWVLGVVHNLKFKKDKEIFIREQLEKENQTKMECVVEKCDFPQ